MQGSAHEGRPIAAPETPLAQGAHSEVPIAYVLAGQVAAEYAHEEAPWVL